MQYVFSCVFGQIRKHPYIILTVVILLFLWNFYQKGIKRKLTLRKTCIQKTCATLDGRETIFVSIPSYRDMECPETLYSLYSKAACPLRIFVGLCQQNAEFDLDIISRYDRLAHRGDVQSFKHQIRIHHLPYTEAKGTSYARSLIETLLFRNEKYLLLIDSHTEFTTNWDLQLIRELHQCASKKAILTTYVPNFTSKLRGKLTDEQIGTYTLCKGFDSIQSFPLWIGKRFAFLPRQPIPNLSWTGRFSFSLSQIIKEVPYDPFLDFVHGAGEELIMSARLYTHGYDFFAPKTVILYHMYNRDYRPVFWELLKQSPAKKLAEKLGYERIRMMLHLQSKSTQPNPIILENWNQYNLGTKRSLQDYETYIGQNLNNQQITKEGQHGLTPSYSKEELHTKTGLFNL